MGASFGDSPVILPKQHLLQCRSGDANQWSICVPIHSLFTGWYQWSISQHLLSIIIFLNHQLVNLTAKCWYWVLCMCGWWGGLQYTVNVHLPDYDATRAFGCYSCSLVNNEDRSTIHLFRFPDSRSGFSQRRHLFKRRKFAKIPSGKLT